MGEEAAVESLRQGAVDYVLKDRMSRLPAAVKRCIQDARAIAERGASRINCASARPKFCALKEWKRSAPLPADSLTI